MRSSRATVNRIVAISLLIWSGVYASMSWSTLHGATRYDVIGEIGFPLALAIALSGIGILLIIQAVPQRALGESDHETPPSSKLGLSVSVWLCVGSYFFLLPVAGFLVTTPLFMAALMVVTGFRRPTAILLTAIGTTLVCWVLFSWLLGIVLPGPQLF